MKPRQTAVSLIALLMAALPAAGQTPPSNAPVLMTAEQINHDEEAQRVTATGQVEISQSGRVMLAERVVYDLRTDRIFAEGDIAILEPTGEVLFARQAEITGDLKNGVAENIRILLTDQSRLAAAVAHRTGGQVTEMERVVYSPCLPCRDKPDAELLWQLKAQHVTHDQVAKDIEYEDVWLEMFGVPVAYTPYLSHPDPTVERRSGFLAPSFSASNNLGATAEIPYHYVLSPSHDFTFSPKITSDEGPVLAGEHRKRFTFGQTNTAASITHDSNDDVRGHIFADGEFHLSDHWRAGYDIERSTDDTYLRRYKYALHSKPFLTSRVYGEGFGQRSYALVESYAFQDQLAIQDDDRIPFVAPLMQYNFVGQPTVWGGHWTIDAHAASLTRPEGSDSQRISVRPAFVVPHTTANGQVVTTTLALQAFGYRFDDAPRPGDSSGGSGRVLPELSVEWRYPFISVGQRYSHVIEPIVLGVASPHWNASDLPNEDSLDFEFSDANLFRTSRFAGIDRQEVGPRVSYGVQYSAISAGESQYSVMVGQSWRSEDDDLPVRSGVENKQSDIVGRLIVSPTENLDLYYRFRLDKEDFAPRHQELTSLIGPPLLRLVADYTSIDSSGSLGATENREQVALGVQSALTENWRVQMFVRHDLAEKQLLENGAALIYEDECFSIATTFLNSRTSDRDLEPGQSLTLQVNFKTLGGLPISVF